MSRKYDNEKNKNLAKMGKTNKEKKGIRERINETGKWKRRKKKRERRR